MCPSCQNNECQNGFTQRGLLTCQCVWICICVYACLCVNPCMQMQVCMGSCVCILCMVINKCVCVCVCMCVSCLCMRLWAWVCAYMRAIVYLCFDLCAVCLDKTSEIIWRLTRRHTCPRLSLQLELRPWLMLGCVGGFWPALLFDSALSVACL